MGWGWDGDQSHGEITLVCVDGRSWREGGGANERGGVGAQQNKPPQQNEQRCFGTEVSGRQTTEGLHQAKTARKRSTENCHLQPAGMKH